MDEKHIDELVAKQKQKLNELREIGQEITSSATPIVVAFVDLAKSTQMKHDTVPEEWLGYIFDFTKRVGQKAKEADGSVIKRIGDELMVTFKEGLAAERFVDSLIIDTDLQSDQFKIALDFGLAYHFRFENHLVDDPYGQVVDRCARTSKLAASGTVICTSEYLNQLDNHANYIRMGAFPLRDFPNPIELFTRSIMNVESENYLEPLINKVNEISQRDQGYRFVGRKLTPEFIRESGKGITRPFIARELLNIPKLPYSAKQLEEMLGKAINRDEKEREFLGYFIELEGIVSDYRLNDSSIDLFLKINNDKLTPYYSSMKLNLPISYLEIVKALKNGQIFRARGIIFDIVISIIILNYVDFEIIEDESS